MNKTSLWQSYYTGCCCGWDLICPWSQIDTSTLRTTDNDWSVDYGLILRELKAKKRKISDKSCKQLVLEL